MMATDQSHVKMFGKMPQLRHVTLSQTCIQYGTVLQRRLQKM